MKAARFPALTGTIVARGDDDYEQARRASAWIRNVPPRRPDLIVKAATTDDVIAVVRHAARSGRSPSPSRAAATVTRPPSCATAGSCSTSPRSPRRRLLDDGVTAQVGPGIRSAELAAFLDGHGRAFPTGHNATVGIGGFLLGGGMGWNGHAWGEFSCSNVEAVDVVTAAGEPLTVSADAPPRSLLGGARRRPGFPAVATGFRLRTLPLPAGMHSSRWIYPFEAPPAVARWLQQHADGADGTGVERFLSLEATSPGGHHCTVVAVAFDHDADCRARRARDARRQRTARRARRRRPRAGRLRPPLRERRHHRRARPHRQRHDLDRRPGRRDGRAGAAGRAGTEPAHDRDGRLPAGAAAPADAAVSVAARGFLSWGAKWGDEDDDAANIGWNDVTQTALEPFSVGSLRQRDRRRPPPRSGRGAASRPHAWERLAQVRRDHDPHGRFPPAW